ncbi:MAG: zf-TFIIB domain-containing protein [Anaerolineae bacterium]
MKCPVCDIRMKEIEKLGILIDICPECKGVWLDRGKLEEIVQPRLEAEDRPRRTDWDYNFDY